MRLIKSNPMDDKLRLFMDDIISVCKKHKLSISHEDVHGSFIIEPYRESNIERFEDAYLGLGIVDE